jgi:mannose-6-phosphate isomerase-like protein (cupin superfamily)
MTSRRTYENPVIGDKIVFLKTSRETNGACTLIDLTLAPGGGNTPHVHRIASETFIALEGNLEVHCGNERRAIGPGESFTVPPGAVHCFRNPSVGPIRCQVKMEPGHEGFENSVKIAYGLATEGLTNCRSIPRRFSHAALLVTMSDTYPTGIFSLLLPILHWKARQARRRGVEQELMNRYCR